MTDGNGWRDKELERVREEVTKLWASITVLQQTVSSSVSQVNRNVNTLDRIEGKLEKLGISIATLDIKSNFWVILGRGVTVLLAVSTAILVYIIKGD